MQRIRRSESYARSKKFIASIQCEIRMEGFRRVVQSGELVFFSGIFLLLVGIETMFSAMMFEVLSIEVLGTVFSGAAFALLVPTVICAAHIKLHHEADPFLKWWLTTLSGIGILVFALGLSTMVGFSAWQAARDALQSVTATPRGDIGDLKVDNAPDTAPGMAEWIGVIPNTLLFLGLSFGLIITVYVASFALGRALQSYNFLTQVPRIGANVKTVIERSDKLLDRLSTEQNVSRALEVKLPFDPTITFSRLGANACWKVGQKKTAAARRKFHPSRKNDPMADVLRDAAADSIPAWFRSQEEFDRYWADVMDSTRAHNIATLLTGFPKNGEK